MLHSLQRPVIYVGAELKRNHSPGSTVWCTSESPVHHYVTGEHRFHRRVGPRRVLFTTSTLASSPTTALRLTAQCSLSSRTMRGSAHSRTVPSIPTRTSLHVPIRKVLSGAFSGSLGFTKAQTPYVRLAHLTFRSGRRSDLEQLAHASAHSASQRRSWSRCPATFTPGSFFRHSRTGQLLRPHTWPDGHRCSTRSCSLLHIASC